MARSPDIFLQDKGNRRQYLTEMAAAWDSIQAERKAEKLSNYDDLFTHATMLSLFSGETTFLTSTRTDGTNQSRTMLLLGDIWTLPSAADEEWNSPKRPFSTVAKLQLSSTCMQR